jgi:hypothetical protein
MRISGKILALLLIFIAVLPVSIYGNGNIEPLLRYEMNKTATMLYDGKDTLHLLNSLDESRYPLALLRNVTFEKINDFTYEGQSYLVPQNSLYNVSAVVDPDIATLINGSFTYEGWINPIDHTGGANGLLYALRPGRQDEDIDMGVYYAELTESGLSGVIVFLRRFSESLGRWYVKVPQLKQTWNHVIVTYNDSSPNNVPVIYVNGQRLAAGIYAGNRAAGTALPLTEEHLVNIGAANSSKVSTARLGTQALYKGMITDEQALALYEASKANYEKAVDVRLFAKGAFVSEQEFNSVKEGAFHADVTISDLDETSARENIYIENANTGEKVACEFEKVGDILRLGASFLTTGEWKFVIDKNILKKDGTPLRKFDYTIEFTVVEDSEYRAALVEEFNNLMDEIDTVGYLAAETFLLETYAHIFRIDTQQYRHIINKEGLIRSLADKHYTNWYEIVSEFYHLVDIQKDKDFQDAITELNEAASQDKPGKVKTILLDKYAIIYDLDTSPQSNYSMLSDPDKIFVFMCNRQYQSVDEVRNVFAELCLFHSMAEAEDLEDFLVKNADVLTIPLDNQDYLKHKNAVIGDLQQVDIYDHETMERVFFESVIVHSLTDVPAGNRDEVKRILTDYAEYIPLSEKYHAFGQKSEIYRRMIGLTYTSVQNIAEQIDAIIDSISNAPSSPSSPTGKTVIGNGRNIKVDGQATAEIPPSPIQSVEPEPEKEEEPVFSDLAGVEWANEAIATLAEKGVISGKEEGIFAPNDYVAREELVKIVILAFDLKRQSGRMLFRDVEEGSWYYNYVLWAYNGDIVNGISFDTFGTGNPITREDLVVILYRAMEAKGHVLPEVSQTHFSDYYKIADYARDIVARMNQAGIVSGVSEAEFAPKSFATRAQAAKMVFNALKVMEG